MFVVKDFQMNRKYLYPILIALVSLGFYFLENFIDQEKSKPQISAGKQEKEATNNYFLPTSTTGTIVHHDYYSLSYSESHEQAEWVAYELKKSQLSTNEIRRPYFEIDRAIPTKAAHWKSYKDSGYDRGHLCPAGDRRFSKKAYNETFLTSNISPQEHQFNAGIWNELEQQIRYWAKIYDGVFIVTGGVLKGELPAIGSDKVSVPNYFYKIVVDNNTNQTRMIGFLFPHKESQKSLKSFVVPVDRIEKLTGIDFFPQLDDTVENRLEASSNTNDWKMR